MSADGNTRAAHRGDQRGEARVGLELDHVREALGHEAPRVAQGLGFGEVVRQEGHVGHDQRAGRAALDARGEGDQHVQRHVERAVEAEHHLGGGVAHEQHGNARAFEPARGRRVVAGQAGEGLARAVIRRMVRSVDRLEARLGLEAGRRAGERIHGLSGAGALGRAHRLYRSPADERPSRMALPAHNAPERTPPPTPPPTGRVLVGELMDAPDVDPAQLARALAYIRSVNRWLGGTRGLIAHLARWTRGWNPSEPIRLLDVATGSADIPVAAVHWARARGLRLEVTAIDNHDSTLAQARAYVEEKLGEGAGSISLSKLDAREMLGHVRAGRV